MLEDQIEWVSVCSDKALLRRFCSSKVQVLCSWKALQKILRIMGQVWLSEYLGWEFIRKPKVNILHTTLNEIAKSVGLGNQTLAGFAEFLDDLCPCGLKDHKEAVRKLGKCSLEIRRGRT